jgi:hypothetical protein
VTFTAAVSANALGAGTPTGTVTFKDGTTTLGTGTLSGGSASFTTSALAVGGHSITASYGSDTNFNSSTSSALSQTVNPAKTSTAVTSSVNPSVFGQSVTFTATVTALAPGSGTPAGTVTFKQGCTVLGTGTLDANGHAMFTISTLPVGSSSVTAAYNGSGNFNTSTSTALNQTVNKDNSTTSLTSSRNPAVKGQSVTFTATVRANAPGGGVPSGTMTFRDGHKKLATATLDATGHASFTTSTLGTGTHNMTAVYNGSTN